MNSDPEHHYDLCKRGAVSSSGNSADDYSCFISTDQRHHSQRQKSNFVVRYTLGHYALDSLFHMQHSCLGLRRFLSYPSSVIGKNIWSGFDEFAFDARLALRTEYDSSYAIEQLLHWEKANPRAVKATDIDFVVKHYRLKKILKSPYERQEAWITDAILKNGRIYLSKSSQSECKTEPTSSFHKKAMYGGFAFENLMGSALDDKNEDGNFYAVYVADLVEQNDVSYRFLMSAEIDCIDGGIQNGDDYNSFVELKTLPKHAVLYRHGKTDFKFFKKYDYWLHCYLSGTKKICIGERDDSGNICNLHILNPLQDFRDIEKAKAVTLNFCSNFFAWLRQVVTDEMTVYQFSFDPGRSSISYRKVYGKDAEVLKVFTN